MSAIPIRLRFRGPVTIEQIKTLRTHVPEFARPLGLLKKELSSWPICVVGAFDPSHCVSLAKAFEAVGIDVDFFSYEDYGAAYLRGVLPAPPDSFRAADTRIELVVRPSFHEEFILRFWQADQGHLQLASLGTQVWARHFQMPLWLMKPALDHHAQHEVVPPERAHSEQATLDLDDALVERAMQVQEPEQGAYAYADGVQYTLSVRRRGERHDVEMHSPEAPSGVVIDDLIAVARAKLRDPKSLAVLDAS